MTKMLHVVWFFVNFRNAAGVSSSNATRTAAGPTGPPDEFFWRKVSRNGKESLEKIYRSSKVVNRSFAPKNAARGVDLVTTGADYERRQEEQKIRGARRRAAEARAVKEERGIGKEETNPHTIRNPEPANVVARRPCRRQGSTRRVGDEARRAVGGC